MNKVNSAVILAAGMGTRLRDILQDKPKGFLELGGKRLISESLKRIIKGGIEDIIIVTGYHDDIYRNELSPDFPQVRFLLNDKYDTTGSMHSLYLAKESLTYDFLLLESDLLYEDRCITALLESNAENEVLISGKTGSGDEVYVSGNNGLVQRINKKKSESDTIQGELVGISKLSLSFYRQLCAYYEANIINLNNAHYEECISDLSSSGLVRYLKIPDIIWTEIDNAEHLQRALKDIYPKIYG